MFEFTEEIAVGDKQESSDILKIFPYVNRKVKRIKNLAEQIDICIEDNNYEELDILNEQLVKESIFLCDHIKRFSASTGNMEVLLSALNSIVGVKIQMEGPICHAVFDCQIPYRLKYNAISDNNTVQQTYANTIYEAIKELSLSMYDKKVVMCFIHVYCNVNDMKDHDNYEYKPIIDAFALHLLHDDNPKFCAHYMDYLIGESNHTEVYVVPEELFPSFLHKLSIMRKKRNSQSD